MKYAAAVGHLRAITADLEHLAGFDDDLRLEEAWVFGELLDRRDQFDVISLAVIVDLPAEEVTWGARTAPPESLASFLCFEKYACAGSGGRRLRDRQAAMQIGFVAEDAGVVGVVVLGPTPTRGWPPVALVRPPEPWGAGSDGAGGRARGWRAEGR